MKELRRDAYPTTETYLTQLRTSRARYKRVIAEQIAKAEKIGAEQDAFGHTFFDSPAVGPRGYFQPGGRRTFHGVGGYTFETLRNEITEDAAKGRRTVAIDHFGNGRPALELGAHRIIATSRIVGRETAEQVTQIPGDALSPEVSRTMTHELDEFVAHESIPPRIIAFLRPVGGLGVTFLNMYVFHRLYSQLRELYNRMADGDLIFIDTIGAGQDLSLLKEIFTEVEGPVATGHSVVSGGTTMPILVKKNSASCPSLPSEAAILQRIPSLARRLMDLDNIDAKNLYYRGGMA